MTTGRRYCWDACVFISMLTELGRTPDQLVELRELAALVDAGDVMIFTPTLTVVEVLACYLTPEQEEHFQGVLNSPNVEVVSVSRNVADKAREIRTWYREHKNLGIAVPDSIHLATAIHFEATALHTYDGCGKRQRNTDLLGLETPIIGKYPLTICTPTSPIDGSVEPAATRLEYGGLFTGLDLPER